MKKMYVYLTRGNEQFTAVTLQEFEEAIKNKEALIRTPLTLGLSTKWHHWGYEIIVISGEEEFNITDALKNGTWRTDRHLRNGHNFEKLVLAGEFKDLRADWLND